jgi:hypothetical protein
MINELSGLLTHIQPGCPVTITDHEYTSESRDNATVEKIDGSGVTIRPSRPWSSQGQAFRVTVLTWQGDLEWKATGDARHGNRRFHVDLYVTPTSITSRSTPGNRKLVKTYTFFPDEVTKYGS